jgi:DNA (cytosine-5)-methyltransferase 1
LAPKLTVGSLFAGIGGFDLGLERAGMEVKWQVEIDPFCRAVLAKHWPEVKRYEDVRTVGAELERVDVICGGFPCKQTSRAAAITGRRVGLAGRDSGLWRHMHRIIGQLQPRIAIVENPDSEWLTTVQGDLAGTGYRVSRWPISAASVGKPHIRWRMFLVADRHCTRLEERRPTRPSAIETGEWLAAQRDARLSALAGVVRVDDGVPGGLHRRQRIAACGNAVVPQVAEWIGRRIIDADERACA